MTMRTTDARICANGRRYGACNWLVADGREYCVACEHNRTVPALDRAANVRRFIALETAKKRLLYTLRELGLPHAGLRFDFLEDGRSDPERYGDTRVATGYFDSVITINVLEADAPIREAEREALNEPQRTLLGHMRHEAGHFFLDRLLVCADWRASFRGLFGDERADYSQALQSYYASGPADDWRAGYISAYASAHPNEDWAETWGHLLHIVDALDTAYTHGVIATRPAGDDFAAWLAAWRPLSVTLNELNRSVGLSDAYPFVVNDAVAQKLRFAWDSVARLRG